MELKSVSKAERAAVKEKHKEWKRHESNRRRIFKELWYKCVDLLPEGMSKDELWVGTPSYSWDKQLTGLQDELGCEGSRIP